MADYKSYFLMKAADVPEYVRKKLPDFFSKNAILECKEIGDGNLNYVFRVSDKSNNKTIIIKQAGQELRISKEMKSAQETASSTDPRYTFNGFGKSWTGIIDYIWYKGPRKCTQFQVVTRKYMHIPFISDHYPIWADFEL